MTLLWADEALANLQDLYQTLHDQSAYGRLVRRLCHLENDASTFEVVHTVVEVPDQSSPPAGAGPLRAHVMEANPGCVFVILYRLALDAEDVLLVGLHHGN